MSYDRKTWKRRIAERTDLSSHIVHLTREQEAAPKKASLDILFDIVDQQRIVASNPKQGFICGDKSATCFQDVPLVGICQNVFYEQKYQEQNKKAKTRYRAIGVALPKDYAYLKGARPVVYDKTATAKSYLPKEHWWRIVNFDLSDQDNFVDWTHEREWRSPGDFVFERSNATLLFQNENSYRAFLNMCKNRNKSYITEVKGIVVMENLLY